MTRSVRVEGRAHAMMWGVPERDLDVFEQWGRATVNAAVPALKPRLGSRPNSGARAPHRVSTSAGRLGVWLFCVPPNQEYSDSAAGPRLGIGVLDDSLRPLREGRLRSPLGGRVPLIRWKKSRSGGASDLGYVDSDLERGPEEVGELLAGRALQALTRLGILE